MESHLLGMSRRAFHLFHPFPLVHE